MTKTARYAAFEGNNGVLSLLSCTAIIEGFRGGLRCLRCVVHVRPSSFCCKSVRSPG